nr:MAG TPA: hypothetical protein [Caudoviricetes sp.]
MLRLKFNLRTSKVVLLLNRCFSPSVKIISNSRSRNTSFLTSF